jgi:hypothetical protein
MISQRKLSQKELELELEGKRALRKGIEGNRQ